MGKAENRTATGEVVDPSQIDMGFGRPLAATIVSLPTQMDMGFGHLPKTAGVVFNDRYVRVKIDTSDLEFILDPRTGTFKTFVGETKTEICSMGSLKALLIEK